MSGAMSGQHIGWDSIIYLAALSAIDPTFYEAATMDGASRLQKIRHIDLPLLLPTAMILLILRAGSYSVLVLKRSCSCKIHSIWQEVKSFRPMSTKWGWLIFNIVTRQRSVSLIPWLTWSSYCRSTGLRNAIPRRDYSRKEEKLWNCFNMRERPSQKSSLIFYLWSSDLLDSVDCLPCGLSLLPPSVIRLM